MAGHLALWDPPPKKNASLKKENLCEGRENTQMPLILKNISLYKLSLIQFKVSLLYLCVSGVSDKASKVKFPLQAGETVSSKGLNLKKKWRGEQREEETRMLCTLTFSKKVISGMGVISLFLVSRE